MVFKPRPRCEPAKLLSRKIAPSSSRPASRTPTAGRVSSTRLRSPTPSSPLHAPPHRRMASDLRLQRLMTTRRRASRGSRALPAAARSTAQISDSAEISRGKRRSPWRVGAAFEFGNCFVQAPRGDGRRADGLAQRGLKERPVDPTMQDRDAGSQTLGDHLLAIHAARPSKLVRRQMMGQSAHLRVVVVGTVQH